MSVIKAVIFDVDGTLIDSVDFHAKAWVDAFKEFGHDFSFDDVRAQIGKGGDQLLPAFLSKEEISERGRELEERRGKLLKDRYLHKFVAFSDVRSLFKKLNSNGIAIALASSAKKDELETYKKIADIADLVNTETSSEDAEQSKPYPDIFQAAMSQLGDVRREDVIVIGDTPYDAIAADQAGLTAIGVLCGGWGEADLYKAGCSAVYADPTELLAKYESWVSPKRG
jgi:HAD superfamily hydrolase (TIGR01549 family)